MSSCRMITRIRVTYAAAKPAPQMPHTPLQPHGPARIAAIDAACGIIYGAA